MTCRKLELAEGAGSVVLDRDHTEPARNHEGRAHVRSAVVFAAQTRLDPGECHERYRGDHALPGLRGVLDPLGGHRGAAAMRPLRSSSSARTASG